MVRLACDVQRKRQMKALVIATVLVTLVDSHAHAARGAKTDTSATPERVRPGDLFRATGRAFAGGLQHTWHSVRPHKQGSRDPKTGQPRTRRQRWMPPAKYAGMIGGIFLLGAGMHGAGVNPEPYMFGGSIAAFGVQVATRAVPRLRSARKDGATRLEMYETAVEELVYPASLVGISLGLGFGLGHEAGGAPTLGSAAQAGGQGVAFGFDVPTLFAGALDHSDMGVPHHTEGAPHGQHHAGGGR